MSKVQSYLLIFRCISSLELHFWYIYIVICSMPFPCSVCRMSKNSSFRPYFLSIRRKYLSIWKIQIKTLILYVNFLLWGYQNFENGLRWFINEKIAWFFGKMTKRLLFREKIILFLFNVTKKHIKKSLSSSP